MVEDSADMYYSIELDSCTILPYVIQIDSMEVLHMLHFT